MPSLSPASDPDFGAARAAGRGGGRSLTLVVAAALLSAAALLWAVNDPLFAGAFLAGLCGLGAILLLRSRLSKARTLGGASPRLDVALLRDAVDSATAGVAITDEAGALLVANDRYGQWLGTTPPLGLPQNNGRAEGRERVV